MFNANKIFVLYCMVCSTKVSAPKCMYIKVKLVFRFPFVGHEFRQGPVYRTCAMEKKPENKALFAIKFAKFHCSLAQNKVLL